MGNVIAFPRRHARAPSFSRAVNLARASKVISGFPLEASSTTPGQWGLGMPLDRQPLTVESDWARARANIPVPPHESTITSHVKSIDAYSSRIANLSMFAKRETTFPTYCGAIEPMNSPENVRRRLIALRTALGYGGRQQAAFAKELDLAKNIYNPFESEGNNFRPLTLDAACRIRARFGIPLDWIFFGDMSLGASPILIQLGPNPELPATALSDVVEFSSSKSR